MINEKIDVGLELQCSVHNLNYSADGIEGHYFKPERGGLFSGEYSSGPITLQSIVRWNFIDREKEKMFLSPKIGLMQFSLSTFSAEFENRSENYMGYKETGPAIGLGIGFSYPISSHLMFLIGLCYETGYVKNDWVSIVPVKFGLGFK